MKNLLVYYFAILLPAPLLIWYAFNEPVTFCFLLASYYIYRGFIDGQRLIDLNILERSKIHLAFVPFWSARYFGKLYFN
jgi:hypothetical protein